MYKENPLLFAPEDDRRIWRYMDFTKFISLLDKSALYFVRADKLEDTHEGSLAKINEFEIFKQFFSLQKPPGLVITQHKGFTGEDIKSLLSGKFTHDTFSEVEYHILAENPIEFSKQIKIHTVINSWHLNEYESFAMWKLYLKSNEGIAITSSFKRLKNALIDNQYDINIGKVTYIDYNENYPIPGLLGLFYFKRKSFEFEQELRAVIQNYYIGDDKFIDWSKKIFDDGIYITVDLPTLIEKIYVAPTCPAWLSDLVKSVLKKYRLDKEVYQSSLDDKPIY